jgi:hypothetical protein
VAFVVGLSSVIEASRFGYGEHGSEDATVNISKGALIREALSLQRHSVCFNTAL